MSLFYGASNAGYSLLLAVHELPGDSVDTHQGAGKVQAHVFRGIYFNTIAALLKRRLA